LSVSSVFPSFFFSCSRTHRDLPSFPTRRSSDLSSNASWVSAKLAMPLGGTSPLGPFIVVGHEVMVIGAPWLSAAGTGGQPVGVRSEEHTSELQSRGHLVCRLLLEKKKEGHS